MIKKFYITVDGVRHEVEVEEISSATGSIPKAAAKAASVQEAPAPDAPAPAPKKSPVASSGDSSVTAPLQGLISDVKVKEGQTVKTGEIIVIIEAMKMENEVVSPRDGVIEKVAVCKGESVAAGDLLISFK